MQVLIYLIVAAILFVVVGTIIALHNFDKNVSRLFLQSEKIKGDVFYQNQVSGLPTPVRNYFIHVLKEGQPPISFARVKHTGRFRIALNSKWTPITGEEYFTIAKPGLLWKGKTKKFTAVDAFLWGKGSLSVYLFGFIRISHGSGCKFSQSELLRWLGESVWFPTALLPNDHIYWEPIDNHRAKLVFSHKKTVIFYNVTFNDDHEIVQLETNRYMGNRKLETWVGKLSNYKMRNNILIPTTIQATWKLKQQDFTYAVFNLIEIDYDQPKKFN